MLDGCNEEEKIANDILPSTSDNWNFSVEIRKFDEDNFAKDYMDEKRRLNWNSIKSKTRLGLLSRCSSLF